MITIFNRAKLFTDNSAQAAADVWNKLKANKIPYAMKTLQNHTSFGKTLHASYGITSTNGGMRSSVYADQITYTYIIYVRKKDEAWAREICGLRK